MTGACREVVKHFDLLRGRQNETVTKELCLASATAYSWNFGAYGKAAVPKPSFSTTSTSTCWPKAWPSCATPCVVGSLLGAECSRAAERDEKPQDDQAIFQNSIYYTDATTHFYHARIFNLMQQQLRDYIVAMRDVLSYVTTALTSVAFVETAPNASKRIDYPHLYEQPITFV